MMTQAMGRSNSIQVDSEDQSSSPGPMESTQIHL